MMSEEHITQHLEHIKITKEHLDRWLTPDRVEEITAEMVNSFRSVTEHVIKRDINIITKGILGGSVEELIKAGGE